MQTAMHVSLIHHIVAFEMTCKVALWVSLLFLIVHQVKAENALSYAYQGFVEINAAGDAILKAVFTNNSQKAICVKEWPPSKIFVYEELFSDFIAISNEEGDFSPYISLHGAPAGRDVDFNYSTHVVPIGSSLMAHYNLSKLYLLPKGEYSVTKFSSVIFCHALSNEIPYLSSSVMLKNMYVRGFSMKRMNKNSPKHAESIQMENVTFETM